MPFNWANLLDVKDQPWPLCSFRDMVLALHSFRGFGGFGEKADISIQRSFHIPNTKSGNAKSPAGEHQKPEREVRHVPLSIKVLTGIGLFLSGLYSFGYALHHSRTLAPGAGIKLFSFGVFVVLAGTYLIATGTYPEILTERIN